MAFFVSTIVWLFIEAVYSHTIPFALITYPVTFLSVIILSRFCMNEFSVIWSGTWEDPEWRHNKEYRGLLTPDEKIEDDADKKDKLDDDIMDGMRASTLSDMGNKKKDRTSL